MSHEIASITELAGRGYMLERDDGERFMLLWGERGNANLFKGWNEDRLPVAGLVDFDISITDKLAAARKWVLAYPKHPSD